MEREEKEVKRTAAAGERETTRTRQSGSGHTAARRSSSNRSRTSAAKRSSGRSGGGLPVDPKLIIIAVAAVVVLILIIVGVRSCGSTHRSPENVVKALIKAETEAKAKTAKDCYGAKKDTPPAVQSQIDAAIEYYQAHNLKSTKIVACDALYDNGDTAYVYITFNLVLENDQEYPCIATFMTKLEEKKYYVLAPDDITAEMSDKASEAYAKFMTSEVYKNYAKTYDTFIKKNPGYEDKIIAKLA